MEVPDRVSTLIQDPRKRLLNRVSACMLREPNYYQTSDSKVTHILNDLVLVADSDPEYVCQLAVYARQSLNMRSISNFLLAWADTHLDTRGFLAKYFSVAIRLPSDLLETVELNQKLKESQDKYCISNVLQGCVARKMEEFTPYQLGKYCSEGRRKRLLNKPKTASVTEKGNLNLKKLVRLCHVSKPATNVMSILGKRYPEDPDVFAHSSLATEGEFNPALARKRMKIETPVTWETELSSKGNKAETWEELIKEKKLPFMAMIRNLRNLLEVGVDRETHEIVMSRLRNPQQIENSRMFPFRFFSAYEAVKVDLEQLQRIKEDPEYQPPVTGKRALKTRPQKNKKIPKEVPSGEVIENYKKSLDEAVKLACALNTSPIRGHCAIFVDVSGSMQCPISGGKGLGSVRRCMEAGLVMGLMLRNVCESSEFILLSSPGPGSGGKCWMPVDLTGDDLLGQMEILMREKSKLGDGNLFPYDYMERMMEEGRKIDYWFILSDMIVAPGHVECEEGPWTITSILEAYRSSVNPEMKFVTVDLAGHGRSIIGADIESDPRNIVISGYSDSILRMVNEINVSQVDMVKEFANNLIKS